MSMSWHNLARCFVAGAVLLACGGQAEGDADDVECEVGGKTYQPGDDFVAPDGCNSCRCEEGGNTVCTTKDCQGTCEYQGDTYADGDMFSAGDGCNTCSCEVGVVRCSTVPCNRCLTIENQYASSLDAARLCDPALDVEQCTQKVTVGLACSCPSFLNPANAVAIVGLSTLNSEYHTAGCSSGVVCGPCLEPIRGRCSPAGVCEDVSP